MTHIVEHADWLEARRALLDKEKELSQMRDSVAMLRRAMPLVRVDKPYTFDTEGGRASLVDLFGVHQQLVLYHFMFAPDWEAGCKMCSYWADSFNGAAAHLAARDTAFAVTSNAPLDKLLTYRTRMGWSFRWVSTGNGPFHHDFGVSFPAPEGRASIGYNYSGKPAGAEMPGLSVFQRLPDGGVGHSYSTFARGLDALNTTYQLLDLTPLGRGEADLDFSMSWVRRRDEYAVAAGI